MSEDDIFATATATASVAVRPALPEPQRERWQPLRLGLVELFHYDSEEFWFRDGHLLLRGNNGTGKSKVLSLTLPFLFDANLRSGRIEPDGDNGKKMAWNLLLNSYPRRIGYTWIEFGRRAADGSTHYVTLGAGLSAVAGRSQVESWFFILADGDDGGARIGRDLWLTNAQGVVLTRERLREAIEGCGQLFDTANSYRRAVDERLFQIGQRRYDALMDTLIQLRQPQLSRKPDEAGLSHALTEALPPLPQELLTDVAVALNQLEEDRRQLDDVRALEGAVKRFDQRYRIYASMLSRRQARELRQAQTEFDNASHARLQAQAGLGAAQTAETAAVNELKQAESALAAKRSRLETLQSDPTMQDANRLDSANKDAINRWKAVEDQKAHCSQADGRLQRETQSSELCAQRAAEAEQALLDVREEYAVDAASAGIGSKFAESPLLTIEPAALADLASHDFEAAPRALRTAIDNRREQLAVLERRHSAVQQALQALTQRQQAQGECQEELEEATVQRTEADMAAEQAGQTLVTDWAEYAATLVQLRIDAETPLQDLGEWVVRPEGDNPCRLALQKAQQNAQVQHAARQAEIDRRRSALQLECAELDAERAGLLAGRDAMPPTPHTRGSDTRGAQAGAPLWQLVEFREHVDAAQRAGLEAALEASGLLDAWVTPSGTLLADEKGEPWLDSQWTLRPGTLGATLAEWLCADVTAEGPVPAALIERLLASVACGADNDAEAWVAPDGRFRLGTLAGAWTKPQAIYIGQRARALARQQRVAAITVLLAGLADELAQVQLDDDRLADDRRQAGQEWAGAPSEQALHQALRAAASAARDYQAARGRLDRAEALCRAAESEVQSARDALRHDATDMGLPLDAEALPAINAAIQRCLDGLYRVLQTAQEWRRAQPELARQRAREAEAQAHLNQIQGQLAAYRIEAEEAQARFEVLRDTVGADVDNLLKQLREAREAVGKAVEAEREASDSRRIAGEERARAGAQAGTAEQALAQRGEARTVAVARLQHFAASSLLSSALPTLELPDLGSAWTIDPALTLARRAEQALAHISDDEASWNRVQRLISEDLQDLQRALTALGHHATAEANDWGFVVHIIYHNRPERPDLLAARLADDIAQRSELLSANERAILENHLQAEIASEVQRLLRAAEHQVNAINSELHKRPTSTGVRYRLRWQPLGTDEGAPVGLDAARERLLNTSADLWSAEDRRVVGTMLQMRITAERERADAEPGGTAGDGGGSLIDQLARALDYRRWHHFRVERLQDGQWRKLSGPASSGERALGLTVPLFAAISSFYSQGCNPQAPRLMLLDEAFAGIDDAARAHCMGLIHEFDLDFVITSEREWACYAELPGVAICQLQRREGIDAVFVSRWMWDGRARRREADPDRRFATS